MWLFCWIWYCVTYFKVSLLGKVQDSSSWFIKNWRFLLKIVHTSAKISRVEVCTTEIFVLLDFIFTFYFTFYNVIEFLIFLTNCNPPISLHWLSMVSLWDNTRTTWNFFCLTVSWIETIIVVKNNEFDFEEKHWRKFGNSKRKQI